MKLHILHSPPPDRLGQALENFEAQFRYPLGKDTSFSISHGRDYITFFSAIGDATLVVAEDQGRVLATLAAALRPLRFPDGHIQNVAYLGDLKVDPSARGGTVLGRLFKAMREQLASPSDGFGYGVVMGGTSSLPSQYTGRLSIPAFEPVCQLTILCISTATSPISTATRQVSLPELLSFHQKLASCGFVPLGGNPHLRSQMQPLGLVSSKTPACGLLEDTHRAKRLLLAPGKEIEAAHLSRFAFATPESGADIIRHAATLCAKSGIPKLFLSIPATTTPALLPSLQNLQFQQAPATVYACGFPASSTNWWIDTAEI